MQRNHRKSWTHEQEQLLLDSYGQTTITYLCNKLGKTETAIKQKIKELTGSYDMHAAGGNFTAREVANILGVENNTIIDWIRHKGFPAKRYYQKKDKNSSYRYFINPYEAWRWVRKNKERISFAHIKRGILLPEPDWLGEEIKKDIKEGVKRPTSWTKEEDEQAWFWYKGGVNYREIAKRLGRPEKGTQRRLTIIKKRKQKEGLVPV